MSNINTQTEFSENSSIINIDKDYLNPLTPDAKCENDLINEI